MKRNEREKLFGNLGSRYGKKLDEPTEAEVQQSAANLIQQHGEGAELEAAIEADKFIARGDPQGERTWTRIMKAIQEMQAPRSDDTIH